MKTSCVQRIAFSSLAIASVIMIAGDESIPPPCPPPPCWQEYYNCSNPGGTCTSVTTTGPLYRQAPVGQSGMTSLGGTTAFNQITYTGGGPTTQGAFACNALPTGWTWVDGKCPGPGNPQLCCAYDPTVVTRIPQHLYTVSALAGEPCIGAAPTPPPCEWEN